MNTKIIIVIFVLTFVTWTQSKDKSSFGVKVRLTRKFYSYLEHVLTTAVKDIKFPRIQVDVDGGPGHGKIEISKIRFAKFESPEYSIQLLPPNGIHMSSKGGTINLMADWAAWYKFLFKVTLDGTFSATAENLQLTATIDLSKGKDGRPELKMPNCKTTMGNVKVKIAGGPVPAVINLFRGPIAEAIQNAYETQVCKKIQDGLNRAKTLPPKIPLFRNFLLDYTLTEEPTVTNEYVQGAFYGSITYMGEPPSIEPPKIPNSVETDRMMYIWATDYVPNSLFTSAQKNNILKYEISREKTPQYAPFLRTTCPGSTCIGTYREQIAEMYPNTSVIVDIWSSEAPKLVFNHEKSEITLQIKAKVTTEPTNSTMLLYLQADLKANLLPYIVNNNKVAGNATIEELDLQVLDSKVGEISPFEIWVLLDVIKPKLQDAINGRLSKGVLIPTTEGIHLVDPKIKMLDRAIQIETDVKYKDYEID